ncbi:MAG: Ig-like domain-containing protein [Candidatus Limnocylindrales bacterium]
MAAALVLLAGAGLAFAGGALDSRTPGRTAVPTTAPPPAPALAPPGVTLLRAARTDLNVMLPGGLDRERSYVLNVYVNDTLVREHPVLADARFEVRDIPLEQGANDIVAALVSDGRVGAMSPEITITRDDIAPLIRISRPTDGAIVYSAAETLRGRTEPGADLAITNESTGEVAEARTAADGRFEAPLYLEMGSNNFRLESEDAAGNRSSVRFVVTRAVSLASINIGVSRRAVALAELPTTISVRAVIRDEVGEVADGATVTFSVSPPNRATTTYETTSVDGIAKWPQIVVTGDQRAIGNWLITVRVVLASGEVVRGDAAVVVTESVE